MFVNVHKFTKPSVSDCFFKSETEGKSTLYFSGQIRATPDFLAASATASATALPTRGSKAAGIM